MTKKPFNCSDQESPSWRERSDLCAALLREINLEDIALRIADVGCGDRKLLQSLAGFELPYQYVGFDLIPQSEDVIQFDATKDRLPRSFDVIVLLGVIEYISDLDSFLGHITGQARHIVLSHVIRQGELYNAVRLAELGWVNHLTKLELFQKLSQHGLSVDAEIMTGDQKTILLKCSIANYPPGLALPAIKL
jgi:2-polyprenyl-3-methyl-5-hydroxy-6-metoxy-1,4-benzoquinol methylase